MIVAIKTKPEATYRVLYHLLDAIRNKDLYRQLENIEELTKGEVKLKAKKK